VSGDCVVKLEFDTLSRSGIMQSLQQSGAGRGVRRVVAMRFTLAAIAALALPAFARAQQQQSITGRVTAQGAGTPLVDARVFLVGTNVAAATNSDGRYTLRGVPAGAVSVRVLHVGFRESKQAIVVGTGATSNLDFSLETVVVQLQEIVTTATGEQRRVEIGNSVTTLGDINKKVETTNITNLQDLLVAKAAGVTVLQGAMTQSAPTIRVRGLNSMSLNNAPIFVIDGIRMNSGSINGNVGGTNTSFLNDISPEEIEDIEIVKGPSAATLYGTDAANGVVVITTKKGRAGNTRWTWSVEGGNIKDDNKYPSSYAVWGHAPATPTTVARCNLISIAAATCIKDSITSANLFKTPGLSPLSPGSSSEYNGQVNGGSDAVRFFLAASLANQIGPVKMPDVFIKRFDSLKTTVRDEWIHPEAFQRANFRTNLSATLNPKIDVSVNAGWSKTDQRLPQVDNNTFSYFYNAYQNPGFIPPSAQFCAANAARCLGYPGVDGIGYDLHGYGLYSPGELFQRVVDQDIQRFIGSFDAQWRPFAWMQNSATVGMDFAARNNLVMNRFGEGPASGTTRLGTVTDNRNNDRVFSTKLVSTASWQARASVNFKTTAGFDYLNDESEGSNANGTQLPPGAQTVGAAAVRSGTNTLPTATKTLGLYVQEQASIRDRLFITVAVRSDQNSAFGTNFQRVFYPKAHVSWLMSDEGWFPRHDYLNQFRLRIAYGASGVQPGATQSFRTFQAATQNINAPGATAGADTPGLIANALGNPDLKPETSAESEIGFDTRLFNSRMNVEFTYYNKKTRDALVNKPIAPSAGASSLNILANLGSVQNTGMEAVLTTSIIDRRAFAWDVTVSGSHNTNKILKIFGANGYCSSTITTACDSVGTGTTRNIKGNSINARYYIPFTFADANNDHIIADNEVTVGTAFEHYGYSQPRDLLGIQNGFEFFNRKLRISTLLDYKGGFTLFNSTTQFYCQQTNFCYDVANQEADLADQARNVAQRFVPGTKTQAGYLENGQFWRLREVSGTYTLPNRVAAKLRARDLSLTASARNVHVWTAYKGIDPESGYGNGDVQNDFSTTSPAKYFIVRLNLHY